MRTLLTASVSVLVGIASLASPETPSPDAVPHLPIQEATPPLRLPTRAFVVHEGAIALQAGVMRDPQIRPMPLGKFRYPTRYFVTVRNETTAPVWVALEWHFPGEKPHASQGKRLDPSAAYTTTRSTFGVIDEQPIGLRFTVYADEARSVSLGSEDTFMRFAKSEKEAFLKNFARTDGLPLMSGWPEMGALADSVPGSLADRALRSDVQLLLWKEESKQHRDCRHDIVRATPASIDSSALVLALMASDSATAEHLLTRAHDPAQASVHLERWVISSCDTISAYEVLLTAGSTGGTDILVRKAPDPAPIAP
jgi:hypothetical protein